ncbi:uncharacterized protein LY79DRAFT_309321 [Colletotrichum navitas]|uniref:Uncharacterized protein n=1 Tax=Colletotrichum navitas TaxID=681940 RepID=A0AAD8PUG3_9PEZI|nr:uncharacterized protein LY79DRAFT_309321 [Colletotrichum navitas]KAK1580304.1 hypothetical protein LY79DRAFT_309321 [Colletotrichum navitas]
MPRSIPQLLVVTRLSSAFTYTRRPSADLRYHSDGALSFDRAKHFHFDVASAAPATACSAMSVGSISHRNEPCMCKCYLIIEKNETKPGTQLRSWPYQA